MYVRACVNIIFFKYFFNDDDDDDAHCVQRKGKNFTLTAKLFPFDNNLNLRILNFLDS